MGGRDNAPFNRNNKNEGAAGAGQQRPAGAPDMQAGRKSFQIRNYKSPRMAVENPDLRSVIDNRKAKIGKLDSGRGNDGSKSGGKQAGGAKSAAVELFMLLMKIGLIVIFFAIMFIFFFGIMKQPDNSMSPAIKEGDLIIYYRLDTDYESRDVVMVENEEGELQCRRVVAAAGDTLDITDSGLQINGYNQQEDDIYTETLPYISDVVYPVSIETGNYFVLADNREDTEDSRVYGQVDQYATKGAVLTILRRRNF